MKRLNYLEEKKDSETEGLVSSAVKLSNIYFSDLFWG